MGQRGARRGRARRVDAALVTYRRRVHQVTNSSRAMRIRAPHHPQVPRLQLLQPGNCSCELVERAAPPRPVADSGRHWHSRRAADRRRPVRSTCRNTICRMHTTSSSARPPIGPLMPARLVSRGRCRHLSARDESRPRRRGSKTRRADFLQGAAPQKKPVAHQAPGVHGRRQKSSTGGSSIPAAPAGVQPREHPPALGPLSVFSCRRSGLDPVWWRAEPVGPGETSRLDNWSDWGLSAGLFD